MNAPSPRQRKSAAPQTGKIVKASVSVRADLHSRWAAAAALSGMTKNAFAVQALTVALKGIHIIDRRKTAGLVKISESASDGDGVSESDDEAA